MKLVSMEVSPGRGRFECSLCSTDPPAPMDVEIVLRQVPEGTVTVRYCKRHFALFMAQALKEFVRVDDVLELIR